MINNTPEASKLYALRGAVVPITGCWIVDIKPGAGGYVRFYFEGRMLSAHRVMYERHKGPLDPGDVLIHTCADPACINYRHLEIMPEWESRPREGSGNRLTLSQRRGVLTHLRAGKLTQSEIASRYGVSTQTVYNINRKRKAGKTAENTVT